MKRLTGVFQVCFGRCKVNCEDEEDEGPILIKSPKAKRNSTTKRPPRFPKETKKEPVPSRPKSPFDKRLKRLGEKIEAEVQRDCNSRQSQGDSASEVQSWTSNVLLNSADSINTAVSSQGDYRKTVVPFPSLEALEADCYRNIMDRCYPRGPFSCASCSSSSASLSPRDLPTNQYLFYEDEDDVVMEFLPSLTEIRQVC